MAGHIVKYKEALSLAFGEALKDVNGIINLCKKIITSEIPIEILSCLEHKSSFPCGCENAAECEMMDRRGLTCPHHAIIPNLMLENQTPLMSGHCLWPLVLTCLLCGSILCCAYYF